MPFTEDDLLPISALQHLEFCPRRCALVHVEGIWAENAQTAEGRALHRRVHEVPSEMVAGVRVARGLRLCSRELGLFGVADVVEFHPMPVGGNLGTAPFQNRPAAVSASSSPVCRDAGSRSPSAPTCAGAPWSWPANCTS